MGERRIRIILNAPLFFHISQEKYICVYVYMKEQTKRREKNGTKARSRNVIRSVENHFPPRVPFLSLRGKNREPDVPREFDEIRSINDSYYNQLVFNQESSFD